MIERPLEQHVAEHPYEDALTNLLTMVRPYMPPHEIDLVIKAFQMAHRACGDVRGTRPLPPMEHALAVTNILARMMHVDAIAINAGLIFEAVDAELLSFEQVAQELGRATARVVSSMKRLNILERKKQHVVTGAVMAIKQGQLSSARKSHNERDEASAAPEHKKPRVREALRRQQAETVRKMFVAMAEDPRVVLLKLAYRLNAMRLMVQPGYQGDRQEMITMAQETQEIYAPLAGRLGMSRMESELHDLAFQVEEPEKFNWVSDIVEMESKQWRSYVERVCSILRAEMGVIGVKAEVSGRVKHAYSFYRKLVRNTGGADDLEHLKKAADISQIHDLVAFRILVDTTTDCYVALGHVHSLWRPKEGRIKDFIANPKPNGYSALHTTIFCLDDQLVEVQIRTHTMHEMAEYGVAMHWHYKDAGDQASASAKELLTWLRQLSEWQHELRASDTSDADFVNAVKDDIFQEQIFVFTPRGEVKDLPVGSTPLDFAYRIHSKVGDSCAGARIITPVDGADGDQRLLTRMVSLDYELKSGEIVDIVTSRSAHPTRDWLNVARTAAARSKIRRYVKIHERPMNIQIGRERLDRELKSITSRGVDAINEEAETLLCRDFQLDSLEDILASIGADDLRPHPVIARLADHWQLRETKEVRTEEEATRTRASATNTAAELEVAGVSGLLTRLANCCCPLPGDSIVGFVSRGKGVIVHRSDCRNLAHFRTQERERLINVNWKGMSQQRYHAPIVIIAQDYPGLVRDIAAVVADLGANLVSIDSRANRDVAVVNTTLEINDLEILQRLFTRLEKVKGVTTVARDLGGRR